MIKKKQSKEWRPNWIQKWNKILRWNWKKTQENDKKK